MRARGTVHGEWGVALLAVVVLLLIITASSAVFIWFMNQQQTRSGVRYRSAAAMAAAEAGVHRALSILEMAAADGGGPGRTWRPASYQEPVQIGPLQGRFALSLADNPDGAIVVTSAGEVAGVTRRLRARVYLASPALLAALHGAGVVHLERPPAAIVILPYGAGIGDRPWIHIAAGRGIEFATSNISINDPATVFEAGPGPVDAPESAGNPTVVRVPGPARLLLARDAEMTLGEDHQRVDVQQLRVMGVRLEGVVLHTEGLPVLPDVDRAYYKDAATANTRNAGLNETAGQYFGDGDLARKQDSLYTQPEFERLMAYLRAERSETPLRGVIYIKGGMWIRDGHRVHIADGALVVESTVYLGPGASFEVIHSTGTRTLPGIITLDNGALVVTKQARLRVHGLVYARRMVDIGRDARVDIVGAVLDNDSGLSFRSFGASVVIRYDPAVFGTPGLRLRGADPAAAWVAAWGELP